MSGMLHERWLGKLISGWDRARKSNAFEERYLACLNIIVMRWNFGTSNEIASHVCFSGIMLLRNLELHFAKCEFLFRTLLLLYKELRLTFLFYEELKFTLDLLQREVQAFYTYICILSHKCNCPYNFNPTLPTNVISANVIYDFPQM